MFSQWLWKGFRLRILWLLLSIALMVGTASCSDRSDLTNNGLSIPNPLKRQPVARITEVSPPEAIQKLRQILEDYQPQIAISNPQPNQTLQNTSVTLDLDVQDLPIYQDPTLGLGPHLEVILDNEPYTSIYDLSQPITFTNLNPGSHTLRVFATSPWGESFKNEGAYAQTTFHIFTQTEDRIPDPNLPLLTYNNPIGTYGAEPILLDFYLTNAPLHLVAEENPDDDIPDWRIRAYINGEVFILDQWEPLYLKGFDQGNNWIKLEILDELGNPINNVFNTTARLVSYDRQASDSLSQLIRGEIPLEVAQGIVDPNWIAPVAPKVPESTEELIPAPLPELNPQTIETEEEPIEIEEVESADIPEIEEEVETSPIEETIETEEEPIEIEEIESTDIPEIEEEVETSPIEETIEAEEKPVEIEEVESAEIPEIEEPEIEEAIEEIELPDLENSTTPELEQSVTESITEEESTPVLEAEEPELEPAELDSWRSKLNLNVNLNQWRNVLQSKWNQLDLKSLNPFDSEEETQGLGIEVPSKVDVPEVAPTSQESVQPSIPVSEPELLEETVEVSDSEEKFEESEIEESKTVTKPKPSKMLNLDLTVLEEPMKMSPMKSSKVESMTDSSDMEGPELQQMLSR